MLQRIGRCGSQISLESIVSSPNSGWANARTVVFLRLETDGLPTLVRSTPPKHLDGSLPADFGFDPLNLGGDPEFLKVRRIQDTLVASKYYKQGLEVVDVQWAAESERVHSRWAMLAVAGILVQEIVKPDIFW